jgi:hypothetical protein
MKPSEHMSEHIGATARRLSGRKPAGPGKPLGGGVRKVKPAARGAQNAQQNYTRYLALAQAEVRAGDHVAAENYFQHAEHFFRAMRQAAVQ